MPDEKPSHIKPCPICGREHSHLGARGQLKVCRYCETRAVDSQHRPVGFGERVVKVGNTIVLGGPYAFYAEPDPEAGTENAEVSSTYTCWIDGIECRLYEGVAGWIGLVAKPRD